MISLIIRTHDDLEFIDKSIRCALQQDFPDYEVIVIDDGSEKEARELIDSFRHPRLQIVHQENQGMIKAGHNGLRLARGEFVIFLDGDDECSSTMLSDLHKVLDNNKECAFAYSDYHEIDLRTGAGKEVSCQNILNTLAAGILFRRQVLEEVGFWDHTFIFPEYDLLFRILSKYKGSYVHKSLYVYNRHPRSFTADRQRVEHGKQQLIEKYGPLPLFKEY